MKTKTKEHEDNIYFQMPLERVYQDAEFGVRLAREALRVRDPDKARQLGLGVDRVKEQKKI